MTAIPQKIQTLIATGKKQAMPKVVTPMLCTLVKEPFDNKNFIFEIQH